MSVYFGKIKFYNLKNCFGFIRQNNKQQYFYFYLKTPTEELNPEDLVSFELKESKRGLEAFNIKKIIN